MVYSQFLNFRPPTIRGEMHIDWNLVLALSRSLCTRLQFIVPLIFQERR